MDWLLFRKCTVFIILNANTLNEIQISPSESTHKLFKTIFPNPKTFISSTIDNKAVWIMHLQIVLSNWNKKWTFFSPHTCISCLADSIDMHFKSNRCKLCKKNPLTFHLDKYTFFACISEITFVLKIEIHV